MLGAIRKYQEAIECFDETLKLNPDFEPAKEAKEKILKAKI